MGFFGGSKTYVSSVVYNLAGPEEDRPNYLKSLIAGNVISNSKFSMADTLSGGYLGGPGIKARSFFRWALNNYQSIGLPPMQLKTRLNFNMTAMQAQIPAISGETIEILEVRHGVPNASFWAEKYMLEDQEELAASAWVSDYNEFTNKVIIILSGGATIEFTPDPPIVMDAEYFYVSYVRKDSSGILGSGMWIYRIGTGNTYMDELLDEIPTENYFFPFIPVRYKNEFLSTTYKPDAYALSKKAYKKATGADYDELIEKIEDNDSLEDIDHAYVVFGVPLNVVDNSARKYLFKFFENIRTDFDPSEADYADYTIWQNELGQYQYSQQEYNYDVQTYQQYPDPEHPNAPPDPADIVTPYYPSGTKPIQRLQIKSPGTFDTKMDMTISWNAIRKLTGGGLRKPGAKVGEVWLEKGTAFNTGSTSFYLTSGILDFSQNADDDVQIHWQKTADSWETIQIIGLKHENMIYDGNSVDILGGEALEDPEESGFIIPLHYGVMRSMSLIDSTQMMTSSMFLVLNCYEVVKLKWYQTGFFKVVLFVAIIAIAVFIPPAGAAATAAYASIGAAVGLTGIAAVIAGAVISSMVAMILMRVLSVVGTELFGKKFGMIFAAVGAVVATAFGSGLMAGQSMASIWGSMMSAPNLINLTTSIGNGIAGYVQASAQEFAGKTEKVYEDYVKEAKKIDDLYAENIGYGKGLLDPMGLTNFIMESESQFLTRTLMTGSDIAELSMDMVTNFAEYTIQTRL
jgi:hypothetical protein